MNDDVGFGGFGRLAVDKIDDEGVKASVGVMTGEGGGEGANLGPVVLGGDGGSVEHAQSGPRSGGSKVSVLAVRENFLKGINETGDRCLDGPLFADQNRAILAEGTCQPGIIAKADDATREGNR